MAICCPKSVKACALRITRLGASGAPLDPLTPNSRIQTSGFIELSLSPDISQGEVLEIASSCGDICITDRGCDSLKGFEIQLRLCGVPLAVLEMLTGSTLLDDGEGNFVGGALHDSRGGYCAENMMIELWTKNAARTTCLTDGGANDAFIQWVLPRTLKWQIAGGLDFNSGALEFVLSGYAENNSFFFPSYPGPTFPSYVPGGGDPTGVPSGPPGPVIPDGMDADAWSVSDKDAIQLAGPLAWKCVSALPALIDECGYMPHEADPGCVNPEPAAYNFCGPAGEIGEPWQSWEGPYTPPLELDGDCAAISIPTSCAG